MRENLLKKQPTWGLRRAQGTGQKSATPATLTKVILVLLTMFLIPSAAWGDETSIEIQYNGDLGKLWFNTSADVKYQWDDGSVNTFTGGSGVDGGFPVQAGTLKYWSESPAIDPVSVTYYGLIIGETPLTDKNVENGAISGMSNVSFTAPATLNLNGATINSSRCGIIWKGNSDLTIQFSGNNKIDCTQSSGNNDDGICISGNGGSLNLTAVTDVTDASTLTLTPHPSETGSNNKPAIAGFAKGVTIDSNWGMYYTDDYTTATQTEEYQVGGEKVASTGAGKEVVIVNDFLGIAVAGVPVTSSNAKEIKGDHISGSVSFDSEEKILTLNGATIDLSDNNGYPVVSSIENLTVKLIGKNEATLNSYSPNFIKYSGESSSAQLTFETGWSSDENGLYSLGDLTINDAESSEFIADSYTISNNLAESDSYINPLESGVNEETSSWRYSIIEDTESVKVWYLKVYDLWIGSGRVISTALDATQSGGFSYDPVKELLRATSTNNYPIKSSMEELVISVKGPNCGITPSSSTCAITFQSTDEQPSGKLKFVVAEGAEENMNKFTIRSNGGAISGFSSVTFEDPLKLNTPATTPTTWDASTTNVVISDEIFYDLWVMGQQVTSANASDIFGAAQSSQTVPAIFDAEESTLTLNGLQLSNSTTYPTCIESGLESLTVTLSGDNKFQKGGDVTTLYGFKAQDGKTCNITFEASGSFSFMVQTEPEYAVSGFNKVTYKDNLVAYKKDGKTYISTLRLQFGADNTDNPTAITISPVQEGVELFSHKIAYEINYAKDGMDNIAQTEYTAAIPIATISAGPCIVSAYTIDGDNTKSNATKSYYFIYSESELIIGTESTLDLRNYLLPSIAEEDNWLCDHMTDNTDIISIDSQNGIITGLADGTATVFTQIIDGNKEYSVLNYYISQLSIDVTVQDIIGKSTFASGQSYGTFYNTDQTYAYNVPEGLEAYIIKSVDEEKGEIVTEGTSVLPPSTPVLLYRTSTSGSANYVFTKVSGVEPANTELKYTATEKEAVETSKLYVLYNGQFVKVTSGTKILANHCYLDLANTSSSGTRSYYDIDGSDGTTALREVKSEGVKGEKWNDGEWYTLQGRKFTTKPTKPGLYIVNGKKVVIK